MQSQLAVLYDATCAAIGSAGQGKPQGSNSIDELDAPTKLYEYVRSDGKHLDLVVNHVDHLYATLAVDGRLQATRTLGGLLGELVKDSIMEWPPLAIYRALELLLIRLEDKPIVRFVIECLNIITQFNLADGYTLSTLHTFSIDASLLIFTPVKLDQNDNILGSSSATARPTTLSHQWTRVPQGHGKDSFPERIAYGLLTSVPINTLPQSARRNSLDLLLRLVRLHRDAMLGLGPAFLQGTIDGIDGEKDPRNLLLAFNLLEYILKTFPRTFTLPFIVSAFEVTSCYFPIRFTSTKADSLSVTGEDLQRALRRTFAASKDMTPYVIPFLVDKLKGADLPTKLDALSTLVYCFEAYGPSAILALPQWPSVRRPFERMERHIPISLAPPLVEPVRVSATGGGGCCGGGGCGSKSSTSLVKVASSNGSGCCGGNGSKQSSHNTTQTKIQSGNGCCKSSSPQHNASQEISPVVKSGGCGGACACRSSEQKQSEVPMIDTSEVGDINENDNDANDIDEDDPDRPESYMMDELWESLKEEVISAKDAAVEESTIACISMLTRLFCPDTSARHGVVVKGSDAFLGPLLADCLSELKQPDSKVARSLCRLLAAGVLSASCSAVEYLMPSIWTAVVYKFSEEALPSSQRASLLELIGHMFRGARSCYLHADPLRTYSTSSYSPIPLALLSDEAPSTSTPSPISERLHPLQVIATSALCLSLAGWWSRSLEVASAAAQGIAALITFPAHHDFAPLGTLIDAVYGVKNYFTSSSLSSSSSSVSGQSMGLMWSSVNINDLKVLTCLDALLSPQCADLSAPATRTLIPSNILSTALAASLFAYFDLRHVPHFPLGAALAAITRDPVTILTPITPTHSHTNPPNEDGLRTETLASHALDNGAPVWGSYTIIQFAAKAVSAALGVASVPHHDALAVLVAAAEASVSGVPHLQFHMAQVVDFLAVALAYSMKSVPLPPKALLRALGLPPIPTFDLSSLRTDNTPASRQASQRLGSDGDCATKIIEAMLEAHDPATSTTATLSSDATSLSQGSSTISAMIDASPQTYDRRLSLAATKDIYARDRFDRSLRAAEALAVVAPLALARIYPILTNAIGSRLQCVLLVRCETTDQEDLPSGTSSECASTTGNSSPLSPLLPHRSLAPLTADDLEALLASHINSYPNSISEGDRSATMHDETEIASPSASSPASSSTTQLVTLPGVTPKVLIKLLEPLLSYVGEDPNRLTPYKIAMDCLSTCSFITTMISRAEKSRPVSLLTMSQLLEIAADKVDHASGSSIMTLTGEKESKVDVNEESIQDKGFKDQASLFTAFARGTVLASQLSPSALSTLSEATSWRDTFGTLLTLTSRLGPPIVQTISSLCAHSTHRLFLRSHLSQQSQQGTSLPYIHLSSSMVEAACAFVHSLVSASSTAAQKEFADLINNLFVRNTFDQSPPAIDIFAVTLDEIAAPQFDLSQPLPPQPTPLPYSPVDIGDLYKNVTTSVSAHTFTRSETSRRVAELVAIHTDHQASTVAYYPFRQLIQMHNITILARSREACELHLDEALRCLVRFSFARPLVEEVFAAAISEPKIRHPTIDESKSSSLVAYPTTHTLSPSTSRIDMSTSASQPFDLLNPAIYSTLVPSDTSLSLFHTLDELWGGLDVPLRLNRQSSYYRNLRSQWSSTRFALYVLTLQLPSTSVYLRFLLDVVTEGVVIASQVTPRNLTIAQTRASLQRRLSAIATVGTIIAGLMQRAHRASISACALFSTLLDVPDLELSIQPSISSSSPTTLSTLPVSHCLHNFSLSTSVAIALGTLASTTVLGSVAFPSLDAVCSEQDNLHESSPFAEVAPFASQRAFEVIFPLLTRRFATIGQAIYESSRNRSNINDYIALPTMLSSHTPANSAFSALQGTSTYTPGYVRSDCLPAARAVTQLALSHLMLSTPVTVYRRHLTTILPMLSNSPVPYVARSTILALECILSAYDCSRAEVISAASRGLNPATRAQAEQLLQDVESALLPHLPAIMETLLSVTKTSLETNSRTPQVLRAQLFALHSLRFIASLPFDNVLAFQQVVVRDLVWALDDPKRDVRRAAVKCRAAWYELATKLVTG